MTYFYWIMLILYFVSLFISPGASLNILLLGCFCYLHRIAENTTKE